MAYLPSDSPFSSNPEREEYLAGLRKRALRHEPEPGPAEERNNHKVARELLEAARLLIDEGQYDEALARIQEAEGNLG
jgi:hypothetical protein